MKRKPEGNGIWSRYRVKVSLHVPHGSCLGKPKWKCIEARNLRLTCAWHDMIKLNATSLQNCGRTSRSQSFPGYDT